MRLAAEWIRLERRRRWRSLLALALLVAVSTGTVLTAIAGARRGETAFGRLWARSLPATVTVLPNQPHFDWSNVRKLPEVAALTTFAVAQYQIDGYPLARQSVGFPPGDDDLFRTIEQPSWLAGGPFNPHRIDQVDVTPLFPANYGKGVGDTLTIQLPTVQQANAGWDRAYGLPARGPKIKVRIVGVGRSPWFSDSVGSLGGIQVSPALLARYPDNFLGSNHRGYINALVRLKGGRKAIPEFRQSLAKVSGRSDIDVWDNLSNFGEPTRRTTEYEAACLLAFGIAALAAALFLVGQSVARYTAASVSDLQLLRAPGITPRETTLAASASPSWPRWQAPAWVCWRLSWRRTGCPSARRRCSSRALASAQTGRSSAQDGSRLPFSCSPGRSQPRTPRRPPAGSNRPRAARLSRPPR